MVALLGPRQCGKTTLARQLPSASRRLLGGCVIEQLLAAWRSESSWFWATHGGAELDLLVLQNGLRIGVEIKRADAPRLSASMRQALADLDLDRLLVITPGERSYRLNERTQVLSLAEALGSRQPLIQPSELARAADLC